MLVKAMQKKIEILKGFFHAVPWMIGLTLIVGITGQAASAPELQKLSRSVLLDKIRGGWAGQMIGVSYGAPTEFRAQGRIYDRPITWKPERLENALHQDDLYVEMTFARVLDQVGLEARTEQFGEAFRVSRYHLWHANAGARRALNQGIRAPWSGHPRYNFHANDIDFQIESDFIGLMCPGLPQESNRFCDRVGHVMNYGDGVYGGMFICGMYAAAFFEKDPRRVVEAGLACLPPESQYAQLIQDILRWHRENPTDWRATWKKIEAKWDKNDACPAGAFSAFNIDAKLNGGYVAMGLLYGNGDFAKTLEIATRCGQDSDCNPSSAAGVLGVMLGYQKIPQNFRSHLPKIAKRRFDYTEYSFLDIVRSTEKRALALIRKVGGRVTDQAVWIPRQKPVPARLEQWSPGIPNRLIRVSDPAWKWQGAWEKNRRGMRSTRRGDVATLEFTGRVIAILGRLSQEGGLAEVFIDGQKQDLLLDAYIVPNTHDNVLWQIYGLAPGRHTLRIVTLGRSDPRSRGQEVQIEAAVTYR